MQTGNTSTMIFTVAEIIEHLSSLMTLYPGDVITTGTPPGVAMGMKPEPIYLKKGDVMSLTIDGLGQQLKPSIKTPDSYSSAGEIFLAN